MNIVALYEGLIWLIQRHRRIRFAMPPKPIIRQRIRRETVYGEIYDPTTDNEPLPEPPKKTPEQLEHLRKKISRTAFLKELDEKRLTAALSHMVLKDYKAGDVIFRQGEAADTFYIVEEGTFDVYKNEEQGPSIGSTELGENTGSYDPETPCIGELALLYREERMTTVKAATDGKLWQIDRKLYTRVVVKMAYERRKRHQGYLSSVPMLGTLENYEKVRLCDAVDVKKYPDGEKIFKKGDKADGIYFIEEGEAELEKESGEKKTLKQGDYFGERALLLRLPREATVTAKKDCEVAFLETDAFERLIGKLKTLLKRDEDLFKKVCGEELGDPSPDDAKLR